MKCFRCILNISYIETVAQYNLILNEVPLVRPVKSHGLPVSLTRILAISQGSRPGDTMLADICESHGML